jgi:hypothetical protein
VRPSSSIGALGRVLERSEGWRRLSAMGPLSDRHEAAIRRCGAIPTGPGEESGDQMVS